MHPAPQHSEEPSTPGPVLLALSFLASSPILNRRPPPGHLALLEAAPQQVFPFASFFLLCVHVIVVLYYASWLGRVWQVARSQYAHTLKCLASHPGRVTFFATTCLVPFCPFLPLVKRAITTTPSAPPALAGLPTLCADHTLVALSHRNILILHEVQVDQDSSLFIPFFPTRLNLFPAITVPRSSTYHCQSPSTLLRVLASARPCLALHTNFML